MKNNYWLKSGLYTFAQKLISIGLSIGSFALLVRILDKNRFGVWALFITITALIEVAKNGFIQNALIKFYAEAKDSEAKSVVVTASAVLNIILSIISILLCIVIALPVSQLWNAPELVHMLYGYSLTTIAISVMQHFNFLQQANLNFKGLFYSNLARQGSFFFVIFILFLRGIQPDLQLLVTFMTLTAAAGAIAAVLTGMEYLKLSRKIDWGMTGKMFHFGKYVFGTNISAMIYTGIDQMLLGALMPASSVALYNTANRFNNVLDAPISTLSAIVFPQSAIRLTESGLDAVRHLYEKSVGVLLAITLPMVVMIIFSAKILITLLAGSAYLDAVPALIIITLTSLLLPFIRQFGVVMDSIGKPRKNFFLLLIIAAVNIVVTYTMIKAVGMTGAAWGGAISTFIFMIAALIILRGEIGIRFHAPVLHAFLFYKEFPRLFIGKLRKSSSIAASA